MATETFKYIDDTAANGDAQVSTAHLQRMAENTSYLRHMRGPTSTVSWAQRYGSDATKPPKLGLAQWAAFAAGRYYVPDYGPNTEGRYTVNVSLQGVVDGDGVRVACVSAQGHIGPLGTREIEAMAQNVTSVGTVTLTFSDMPVRPGYNDIYLLVCSNATWDYGNYGTDWGTANQVADVFTTGTGADFYWQAIAALGGDLSTSLPPGTADFVPYIGVRPAVGLSDKVEDVDSASIAQTIGYMQNNEGAWSGAWLAENNGPPDSRFVVTGGYRYYWALLGTLEIHGISITPYATVDWSNNAMVRWYQMMGWNVADVFWNVSRLQNIRQPRTIGATQPQLGQDWPGVWAVGDWRQYNSTTFADDTVGGIREVVFESRATQPDGPCFLEVAWLCSWDDTGVYQQNGSSRPVTAADCTWKLEIVDPDTGTVEETSGYLDISPLSRSASGITNYQTSGWAYMIYRTNRGARYTLGVVNGQPWSHDGCTAVPEIATYWTGCTLRVDITGLTQPKRYIARIKARIVRYGIQEPYGVLITGPMTARLEWGTV